MITISWTAPRTGEPADRRDRGSRPAVGDAAPAGRAQPGPGALKDHQKGHKFYLVCPILHKRMQQVDTLMLHPSHVR
jgi:hypothetical protein